MSFNELNIYAPPSGGSCSTDSLTVLHRTSLFIAIIYVYIFAFQCSCHALFVVVLSIFNVLFVIINNVNVFFVIINNFNSFFELLGACSFVTAGMPRLHS